MLLLALIIESSLQYMAVNTETFLLRLQRISDFIKHFKAFLYLDK